MVLGVQSWLTPHYNAGFPIWLKNNTACPIGTILVSGLPQAEDHQVSE